MDLTLYEILKSVFGIFNGNSSCEVKIKDIKIDSKKINKGDLFVPVKGENFDGHDFINEAFERGAFFSLSDKKHNLNKNKNIIYVEDTLDSLQNLAKFYREKFDNVKIVGITGSVGKSTVKEMLYSVLSASYNVLKTQGNLNGQIGVPLTIFNLNKETDFLVIEMGVSFPGEMIKLQKIVDPDFAIITNIGESHITNFDNIENICNEKLKIIKNSGKNKIYINSDDEILKKNNKMKNTIHFGFNEKKFFEISDIKSDSSKTYFELKYKNELKRIILPCLGNHNVSNVLAVITFALDIGMNLETIISGIQKYEKLPMRQNIETFGNTILIDDTYNSSLNSIQAALSVIDNIDNGKKILILGDVNELGENAERINKKIGEIIAKSKINILVIFGISIILAANEITNKNNTIKVHKATSIDEIIEILRNEIKKKCIILLKASRKERFDKIALEIKKRLFCI
ncbi:MAG: UDP-N-acetylmuramoyl-tripeptide--D-alanyl-D-alanine ligase [Candidatus Improbicoccus pseudotrichonymphae]|uniref:UDP-N-acetylmuramoyl-tripeptide--D-alanyl-D-alanine ligase n=1 Tax=Candidatus Improbicoccus pseudotrichonymphae TaxID=3033792 RepID=A0AA48I485_9FIRM|nr:MAG: UDP-N-acetylmuramoyl-tripeptide--D-alanyl-D-alanine ligase [Candidatus Improbicoccus pseudotrichonymphae]